MGATMLRVMVARTFAARLRGLIGARALPAGVAALWIPRCSAVHTVGMKRDLTLIWLDRTGVVVRIVVGAPPGRWMLSCPGAVSVLELFGTTPAGVQVGATLVLDTAKSHRSRRSA